MKKLLVLLAVVALSALGLAACGGDDDDDGDTTAAATTEETATTNEEATETTAAGGASVEITAAANGDFAFDQTDLTAKAGPVTIDFDNPASLSHDVVIEDESGTELGKTDLVSMGEATTTVDLQPGTYTFFCDVPGHREGGMEGTLTVK